MYRSEIQRRPTHSWSNNNNISFSSPKKTLAQRRYERATGRHTQRHTRATVNVCFWVRGVRQEKRNATRCVSKLRRAQASSSPLPPPHPPTLHRLHVHTHTHTLWFGPEHNSAPTAVVEKRSMTGSIHLNGFAYNFARIVASSIHTHTREGGTVELREKEEKVASIKCRLPSMWVMGPIGPGSNCECAASYSRPVQLLPLRPLLLLNASTNIIIYSSFSLLKHGPRIPSSLDSWFQESNEPKSLVVIATWSFFLLFAMLGKLCAATGALVGKSWQFTLHCISLFSRLLSSLYMSSAVIVTNSQTARGEERLQFPLLFSSDR